MAKVQGIILRQRVRFETHDAKKIEVYETGGECRIGAPRSSFESQKQPKYRHHNRWPPKSFLNANTCFGSTPPTLVDPP
jgi:hypothetical protein